MLRDRFHQSCSVLAERFAKHGNLKWEVRLFDKGFAPQGVHQLLFRERAPGLCARRRAGRTSSAPTARPVGPREDPSLEVQQERPELVQPADGARHRLLRNAFENAALLLQSFKGFAREPPPSVGSWLTHNLERPRTEAASVYICSARSGPLPSSCSCFCQAVSPPTARRWQFGIHRSAVDEPAAFIELLEAARPARVSMEDMGAILRLFRPKGRLPSSEPRHSGKWMPFVSYSGNPARLVQDQSDRSSAGRHGSACSRSRLIPAQKSRS